VVRGTGAVAEECRRADLLIALIPLRAACRGPDLALDRFDLWRAGSHALWIEPDGVTVRTVRDARGNRPWAPARRTARERAGDLEER
jgi:competence protein ComEC